MKTITNTKIAAIIFAAAIVLVVVSLGVYFSLNRGTGRLEVTVNPTDATYSISGKEYTGNQTITLKSGSYNILFKRAFFEDATEKIEIKKGTTVKIDVLLVTKKDVEKEIESLSGADQTTIDSVQQLQAIKDREQFVQDYPITKVLPMTTPDYRIDFGLYGSGAPTIEITIYSEALQQKPESELKESAYQKISSYNIPKDSIVWYIESISGFEE